MTSVATAPLTRDGRSMCQQRGISSQPPSVSRGTWAGGARRSCLPPRPPRSLDSARDDRNGPFVFCALRPALCALYFLVRVAIAILAGIVVTLLLATHVADPLELPARD